MGYIQQASENDDAATVPAAVASTGRAELQGLPDTAAGFAQALVRLRDAYAPNVRLAYHLSDWGTRVDLHVSKPNGSGPTRSPAAPPPSSARSAPAST